MISQFTFTEQELSCELNTAVERLIYTAEKNNIITKEQADQISEYKLVVGKPTLWGRLYAKLFYESNDNKSYLFIVKVEKDHTES
jgi:ABC-type uncharacterized transport system permease subunit